MPSHLDEFRIYADRFDIPEDQKTELVQIVTAIMQNFVDRAFENDPVQHMLQNKPVNLALDKPLVLNFTKAASNKDIFVLAQETPIPEAENDA